MEPVPGEEGWPVILPFVHLSDKGKGGAGAAAGGHRTELCAERVMRGNGLNPRANAKRAQQMLSLANKGAKMKALKNT